MGLNPGKKRRNLVDMAIEPQLFTYVRRPEATLEVDCQIWVDEHEYLHQSEWHYRGQVVDFALNHYAECDHPDNPEDARVDVARIDTCHSEVHQHQFFRSGRPQDRHVIRHLQDLSSLEEAEAAIRDCYDECFTEMTESWESHSARWKGAAA